MTRHLLALAAVSFALSRLAVLGAEATTDAETQVAMTGAVASGQASWDNTDSEAGRKAVEAALAACHNDITTAVQDLLRLHYWFTRDLRTWDAYTAFYDTAAKDVATSRDTRYVFQLLAALGSARAANKDEARRVLADAEALSSPAPTQYAQALHGMVTGVIASAGPDVEKEYRSALELWRQQGLPWECFWAANNIGVELETKGQLDEAAGMYLEAFDNALLIPQFVDAGRALKNISDISTKSTPEKQVQIKLQIAKTVDRMLADQRMPSLRRTQACTALLQNASALDKECQLRTAHALKDIVGDLPPSRTAANGYTALGQFADDISADHDAAEGYYRQALETSRKAFGEDHPDTASAMNNLAVVLYNKPDYAGAEPLYRQALGIRERTLGESHRDTADSLNNLAALLYARGECAAAEALYRQALGIRSKVLGENHRDTVSTIRNLAILLKYKGDYAAAEPLYREVLEIRRKTLGQDHPDTAEAIHNLASLLYDKGDYESAEPLYRQALAITKKVCGENHPDTAGVTNDLANLLRVKSDYVAAEPLYRQVLAIRIETLGANHPDTATSIHNLACLLQLNGDYAAAESQYRQALETMIKSLGADAPETAQAMNNLAILLSDRGDYAAAEPLFREALQARKKALGEHHPAVAMSMAQLARLCSVLGRDANALEYAVGAMDIQARVTENLYAVSSERQRLAYQRRAANALPVLLTVALRTGGGTSNAVEAACLWALRTKGRVLDSMLEDRQELAQNPKARELAQRLRGVAGEIGGLVLAAAKDSTDAERKSRQERVAAAEADTERMAEQLAALSPRYADGRRAGRVTIQDVQRALKPDEVLLEFLKVNPVATAEQRQRGVTLEKNGDLLAPVFVAFAIKGSGGAPVLVNLGPADALERLQQDCEKAMGGRLASKPTASLRALYDKLWQPLAVQVRGSRRVYVSPDGALHFIPFGALVGPDGQFLVESVDICYLASGRDLVRHFDDVKTAAGQLFGDPAFRDREPAGPLAGQIVSSRGPEVFRCVLTDRDRGVIDQSRLPPLPGTRREVEDIRKLFDDAKRPVEVFLGAAASKIQLLAARQPEILHLATHGFFLPTATATDTAGQPVLLAGTDSSPAGAGGEGGGQPYSGKSLDNPMRRCGLALTGAVLTLGQTGGIKPGDSIEGIVTGEEIGAMDLWGTRLVVLSACDTGLGDLETGEGVMGLRRAFVKAGAQNLLITLWPIQDEFTASVMKDFYREFLKSGNAGAALCQAQRNAIAAARAKGQAANPRAWAPFLLSVAGSSRIE